MSVVFLLVGLFIGAACAALVFRARLATAARELEFERERAAAAQRSPEEQAQTFKALSQEALQANMQQLAELGRAQLGVQHETAKGELEKRRLEIEKLVAPLKDGLVRMDLQLQSLSRDQSAARGQLAEQMKALTQLRQETGSLATAMARPNSRGQWGQLQLRRVVELAGMVEHVDFEEQVSFQGHEGNTLRPDMVVNIPGEKQIPVDAKAPPLPEVSAEEARDPRLREARMLAHARGLKSHVNQLAAKEYWARLESSPDFVVMFLPGEHVYSAALEADPTLMEHAMRNRVLIATPTTLLALLHSAAYGWQQQRVAESAQAISALGRELHSRLSTFAGKFAKVGRSLGTAVNAYNDAVGSYESRLMVTARRFGELGTAAGGGELPEIEQITIAARDVRIAAEDEAAGLPAGAGSLPDLF